MSGTGVRTLTQEEGSYLHKYQEGKALYSEYAKHTWLQKPFSSNLRLVVGSDHIPTMDGSHHRWVSVHLFWSALQYDSCVQICPNGSYQGAKPTMFNRTKQLVFKNPYRKKLHISHYYSVWVNWSCGSGCRENTAGWKLFYLYSHAIDLLEQKWK